MSQKPLYELTEYEFNTLKEMGFLWEFYPQAPETYEILKKEHNWYLENFYKTANGIKEK